MNWLQVTKYNIYSSTLFYTNVLISTLLRVCGTDFCANSYSVMSIIRIFGWLKMLLILVFLFWNLSLALLCVYDIYLTISTVFGKKVFIRHSDRIVLCYFSMLVSISELGKYSRKKAYVTYSMRTHIWITWIKGCQLFRKVFCNITHHNPYGLGSTALNKEDTT